jgi:hypothetical protein
VAIFGGWGQAMDNALRAAKNWGFTYFRKLPSLIRETLVAAVILAFAIPALNWLMAFQVSSLEASVRDGSFETSMMQMVRRAR